MQKGFTLLELIIVVAIIALLATTGISGYQNVQENSRNTKRKADLRELKKALAAYYAENTSYPSTAAAWWGNCGGSGNTARNPYIPNSLAPNFIDTLPLDPRNGIANPSHPIAGCRTPANNCYLYRSDGNDYKILTLCTAEGGAVSSNDSFYDPTSAPTNSRSYSYAVWSSPTSRLW